MFVAFPVLVIRSLFVAPRFIQEGHSFCIVGYIMVSELYFAFVLFQIYVLFVGPYSILELPLKDMLFFDE